MSWGEELWDQYENISLHTNRGLEFLDKFCQFIKERCTIEVEYAGKLRRLVKNYQPKKKEEEDYLFSSCKAFLLMMNEVNDVAGQHELIAENMTAKIIREICILLKELKEERKKYLQDGARLQTSLGASINQLEKTKRAYEKAFREADKAQENFHKADADLNLSRVEVGKAKTLSVGKTQLSEDCKTEYANQLQKTNDLQRIHYNDLMPRVFQQLQDMDERRISCIQNFIKQKADIQKSVIPIINKCLDEMVKCAEAIDPKADTKMVVDRYKSGFQAPEDAPFEDLSTLKYHDTSSHLSSYPSFKNDTIKGTLTSGRLKKRGGIFGIFHTNKEDFSDLPPNQRKKNLQQKIDQISTKIQQEMSARDGLLKMKVVYENSPALGDPVSVEMQLSESRIVLDKLNADLQKYQGYLTDADLKPLTPNSHKRDRNSISEESLSRSASDSSVCNPINNNHKLSAPNTPLPAHGSSNSPESGIGTSHTSIPDADCEVEEAPGEYEDEEEDGRLEGETTENEEQLPVLGIAIALYDFEGESQGSIPMSIGEAFEVVELDQGDGWTRVRKSDGEEGFVPTTYIECTLYNNC